MNTHPIGIFDSGSGGLSVWKSIVAELPHESTVYLGDHKNIPYSNKTPEFIKRRVVMGIQFLITKKAKIIVIACNTATVSGIEYFRKTFPGVPIVGVVPVVKTAASVTHTKKFGILSTEFTAKSTYQQNLIQTFASDCDVLSIGNTELVNLIEHGRKDSKQIVAILKKILTPLARKNVDVLVLGCTHFPFLRPQIRKIVGTKIQVLDSGDAVGRHVRHILEHETLLSIHSNPEYQFFTTGDTIKVSRVASHLLETPMVVKKAPCSVQ